MSPDLSAESQKELLNDFYVECDEHLNNIREALTLLEQSVGKAQPNEKVVEELFRNFHSFKGISAIVGLRSAEELAHAGEELLRGLSRGRMTLSLPSLELLMATASMLEQIVLAFRSGKPGPDHSALIGSLLQRGAKTEPQRAPSSRPNASPPAPEETGPEIENARGRGLLVWKCVFVPSREKDEQGLNINSVRARLSKAGEILSARPNVKGEGEVEFIFLVGAREIPADIADWEAQGISVQLLEQSSAEQGHAAPQGGGAMDSLHSPFIAPSHVVRVDLQKLDDLMRIAGEMVIQRSRLETKLTAAARGSEGISVEDLREVNTGFSRSLRELRQAIMRVRLVPVAEIFARMPFVVRDLARDSQKRVRLTLDGQQTELDKYLIERLKDPLLHLVRNAFSHAVETPEERAAAGKPEEAIIALKASTRGDTVLIEVRDDGRGIDPSKVGRRAAELGMTMPTSLDSAGLLNILCAPGFSTRDDVDRTAGRGVGMAVVCNTVRELGGTITLDTKVGKGTKFTLRLPLTLALAETFIVSAAEQTCAIPQSFVAEVMQVPSAEIRLVNRVEVVPYRSGLLPVVRLSALFQLRPEGRERNAMLVLSSERGSKGLLVDRIHGQREVVVRAIRDPLLQVPGIIGATELGDGKPVLILDGEVLTSGAIRPRAEADATVVTYE